MKIEYGIAKTYEDLINNTTSELLWIDGKKVEEAELVIDESEEEESKISLKKQQKKELKKYLSSTGEEYLENRKNEYHYKNCCYLINDFSYSKRYKVCFRYSKREIKEE